MKKLDSLKNINSHYKVMKVSNELKFENCEVVEISKLMSELRVLKKLFGDSVEIYFHDDLIQIRVINLEEKQ